MVATALDLTLERVMARWTQRLEIGRVIEERGVASVWDDVVHRLGFGSLPNFKTETTQRFHVKLRFA